MKIQIKVLIGLAILIAISIVSALIAALFINGEYAVVRETTINQPKDVVFEYVKYLRNQDNFSVWNQMDPNMKKGLTGTDGEVGAIASWDSEVEDVGKGEQEIMGITDGERIDFELRFLKPFESKGNAYFTTESVEENQTKVQWGFDGKMPWPMNLMLLFVDFEKELGPALETGLADLKKIMDDMPAKETVEITEEMVEAYPILFISESSSLIPDEISAKMGAAYGELMALMGIAKLEMAGAPIAITTNFSLEEMSCEMDIAILTNDIPEGLELSGRIEKGETYSGKALKTVHVGSYLTLKATYDAMIAYLETNGYEQNGNSWEEYIDDPAEVAEEERRTNIYFPVK